MPIAEFIDNALEEFDRWFRAQNYVRNTAGHLLKQGYEYSGYVIRSDAIKPVNHNPDDEPDDVPDKIRLELRPELIWYYPDTKTAEHADDMLVLVTQDLDIVVPREWYPHCGVFSVYA